MNYQLKKNESKIEINDFGAGSKRLNNTRKIKEIYKISSSKGKYSLLLYKLAHYYHPKNILEFGTSLGIGTFHLASGNNSGKVTTVEACENTLNEAKRNFTNFKIKNVTAVHSTFDAFLSSSQNRSFDLVYIDGHHDGKALLVYLEKLKPLTHNDTIFILDDIRWSDSMYSAWTTLINDPYYHVSLDFFRMGIILPRKQQVKEHFTIRL